MADVINLCSLDFDGHRHAWNVSGEGSTLVRASSLDSRFDGGHVTMLKASHFKTFQFEGTVLEIPSIEVMHAAAVSHIAVSNTIMPTDVGSFQHVVHVYMHTFNVHLYILDG